MMKRLLFLTMVSACAWAPQADASVTFSGTRFNIDAPGPAAARCGSRATTSIRNDPPTAIATGTSNFGNFTPTLSHCIQLPPSLTSPTPFDLGEWSFLFDNGDTLFGSYSGQISPVSAGLFDVFQTHIVLGGTGLFADTTGQFTSSGTLSFLTGRPTVSQRFSGTLFVPAIPEPGTWGMMLIGFAAVGYSMRRSRRRTSVPQVA